MTIKLTEKIVVSFWNSLSIKHAELIPHEDGGLLLALKLTVL